MLWLMAAAAPVRSVHAQAAAVAGATVWDGVYSYEQAMRGQEQYEKSCGGCHGKDLAGDGTAPSLRDESLAFLFDDMTLGELFDKIRAVMPPDRPNSLPANSYCDIITYLLEVNKMPAGAEELAPDFDVLDKIRITKAPK